MGTIGDTRHAPVGEQDAPPASVSSPRRRDALRSLVVAAVVAALVAAATTYGLVALTDLGGGGGGAPVAQVAPAAPVIRVTGGTATSWEAAVARAVGPSVAQVEVTTPQGRGEGSAVIYRADGYLLTNNHVVENTTRLSVTLPSGTAYAATVVGTDPATDIAVIRIDATNLPAASLARNRPRIGEQVLAIGTPFGLSGTVTEGIISATGRTVDTSAVPLTNMLQTDAAVNPGNSGGALVDSTGRVVGINTAILSPSGTNNGIGFAIPISAARSIAEQLIAHGSIRHGYLGLAGQTVDQQIAATYNLGVDHGAVVAQVQQASPAAAAGLRPGDIITAIDGHTVRSMEDLAVILVRQKPGDRVTLQVYRQGRELRLQATLGEAPTTSSQGLTPGQSVPTVP